MKTKVSVIVPIYNSESYIDKCIQSIIDQSYSNIEIILVNDGSIDNSKSICENYANIDKRIKLINQENQGVSKARNKGLDLAKGKYIGFVDGDDYIEKNMIESIISNIENTKADIGICGYNIVDDRNIKIKKSDCSERNLIIDNEQALELIFTTNKINGFLWNKIFKKELFEKVRLPEDMNICEDLYIVCKLLNEDNIISYTPQALYNYRENLNGATKTIKKLFFENGKLKYIDAFEKIAIIFKDEQWVLDLIRIKSTKTLLETYYLMIKNKYNDDKINKYIISELNKEKKYYLKNTNVSLKHKIAFILFNIRLKLLIKNIKVK